MVRSINTVMRIEANNNFQDNKLFKFKTLV